MPLQPERQNLLFLRRQPGQEVVQLVDERNDRDGGRFLGHDLQDVVLGELALRLLVVRVAAGGPVVGNLPQRLVQGDTDQQLGQVVLVGDLELVVLQPGEESPEHGLDDVLRVQPTVHPLADSAAGNAHEPADVPVEQLRRGALAAGAAALDELLVGHRGSGVGHRAVLPRGQVSIMIRASDGGHNRWTLTTRTPRLLPLATGRVARDNPPITPHGSTRVPRRPATSDFEPIATRGLSMMPLTDAGLIRRDALKAGGGLAVASTLAGIGLSGLYAGESNVINIALIGCGGRGTGAAGNALSTKQGPVKLVAMADVFKDRLTGSYNGLSKKYKDKVDVPEARKFIGFDGYKHAMDSLQKGDVVILGTPPAFRWPMFTYAIEKGLNVFMEKPVAVDGPTARKMFDLAEK